MDIARSYPAALRDEYIQAARNLRLPYWKWDGPSLDIPHLVKSKQVSVLAPSGNHETIKNPLESYVFHPSIASADQWGDVSHLQKLGMT
jgi:tyrosinase